MIRTLQVIRLVSRFVAISAALICALFGYTADKEPSEVAACCSNVGSVPETNVPIWEFGSYLIEKGLKPELLIETEVDNVFRYEDATCSSSFLVNEDFEWTLESGHPVLYPVSFHVEVDIADPVTGAPHTEFSSTTRIAEDQQLGPICIADVILVDEPLEVF